MTHTVEEARQVALDVLMQAGDEHGIAILRGLVADRSVVVFDAMQHLPQGVRRVVYAIAGPEPVQAAISYDGGPVYASGFSVDTISNTAKTVLRLSNIYPESCTIMDKKA